MRKILAFLLAACLLVSAAPALALNNDDAALADNWYEIFVYSFADGNGDRIGDFVGLKEKLLYLCATVRVGDRVGEDNLLQCRVLNTLRCRA